MTDATADAAEEAKKPSKMPLVLGLVAAIIGGGGGFYATFSGLILSDESPDVATIEKGASAPLGWCAERDDDRVDLYKRNVRKW
ncbi:MAG: hypothetical protein AAFO77_09565, partial [Pseudomonadota bacterium]